MSKKNQKVGDINNSTARNVNRTVFKTIQIEHKELGKDLYTSIKNIEWKLHKIAIKYWIFVFMNLLLFAINVILISRFFPRFISENNLHFDYIGAIVGVVAILVTIVMSWNIYTVIDLKNIKSDTYSYIDNEVTKKINDLAISLACYSDALSVNSDMIQKDPDYAIDILIETMESCKGKRYCEDAINVAITIEEVDEINSHVRVPKV
ncbi:hypothetical protein ACFX5L_09340 [Bacteroides sp. KG123]|uniref:hypothetical protein n=1 Tax=unclassified Bacteroides TaxID=2646097 RepID=UPI003D7F88BE